MRYSPVEIGKLCLPTEQQDPGMFPDEHFKYIDISAVDKDAKTVVQTQEILGREAPSRARKVVRAGDILVSTVRPNLNAVAIVPGELDGQIASTGFCVLRPNPKALKSRFLFYRTVTPEFVSFLTARMRGANYPAVTDGVVKKALIPLPPLSEQQRIVEILDQADALRRKRAEADARAERILPALFLKMFGDPAANPMGWEVTTLANGGAAVRYGLGQPPESSLNGVPLIRATNIRYGEISDEDMMFVRPEDIPESRNAFLSADEVIVVRSGAYTGDVAQVTEKWAGAVAGYDLVVAPGERFCGEFIETYLLTSHIQKNYFGNIKARAGQPHLNAAQVSATPILRPPKELQRRFAAHVQGIRRQRECRASSMHGLGTLFAILLHNGFTGNLTAPWREGHMKELLAEMEEQAKALSHLEMSPC
jgi:type I restriction enzyme S subunit